MATHTACPASCCSEHISPFIFSTPTFRQFGYTFFTQSISVNSSTNRGLTTLRFQFPANDSQRDSPTRHSQRLRSINIPISSVTMIFTRAISLTNFLVASSALGFQVFVLYPWHKELDAGFEKLKKEHLKVLDTVGNSLSEQQRTVFSDKLNDLKSQSSRRWWWL